ncbi:hypothetical protein V1477_000569 [Vespula maculifrons]|uniref:Uncharacterized protein n=1 Tax=Vespula maculifrons TaxID=7453 RepID=A0ABD2D262_VESMC
MNVRLWIFVGGTGWDGGSGGTRRTCVRHSMIVSDRISLKVTLYIVSDVADIVGSFYNVRSTQHTVDYQA